MNPLHAHVINHIASQEKSGGDKGCNHASTMPIFVSAFDEDKTS
jgi:hypothetical protein